MIAAVVVGGTSLSGGREEIFGILIGAFIIAMIQNEMNLSVVQSYTQKVVLGLVPFGRCAIRYDQITRVEVKFLDGVINPIASVSPS